ncbi:endolytic transglycosylase MltG, partial [Patescibacteria group bacterium]|nr:endolytic transglycosylase MltG [Patescibacteria group bacterium]
PPVDFPINKIITIEKGTLFKKVAIDFEEQHLIRSAFWFDSYGWLLRSREQVKAGEYFFERPLSATKLFREITQNGGKNNFVRVTIPEGATVDEINLIFKGFGFENFGIDKSLEGYLFPDTYFVPLDISAEQMIKVMRETFDKKVAPEMKEKDIVIMASLLEKEAGKKEDMETISSILWKRIDVGMPLQVDAVFPYIMGKHSLQLTTEDLKIDSPYNTYLHKGLPPGPICNPGLDSLGAALSSTETDYWYYLSDKNGIVYYSKTYEEHLSKRKKYLGK